MASFKNPLGEVVERDESEIFSFDGVDSHKAIDKGGREFPDVGVSQGCGVDCRSNRGRRPPRTEHFRLVGCGSGLHPRQDKCLETRGAGEGGDHDSATPDTAKASSDGAYRPDARGAGAGQERSMGKGEGSVTGSDKLDAVLECGEEGRREHRPAQVAGCVELQPTTPGIHRIWVDTEAADADDVRGFSAGLVQVCDAETIGLDSKSGSGGTGQYPGTGPAPDNAGAVGESATERTAGIARPGGKPGWKL